MFVFPAKNTSKNTDTRNSFDGGSIGSAETTFQKMLDYTYLVLSTHYFS